MRLVWTGFVLAALGAAGCGEDAMSTGAGGSGGSGGAGGGDGGGGQTTTGTPTGTITGPSGPCGELQKGDAFEVCAATYLTADGADSAGGVDIAPDGAVVYGGSIHPGSFGLTPVTVFSGGPAGVTRLSADGRAALSVTRIGGSVTDVAVDPTTGEIAVTGDFGLVVLAADAGSMKWAHQGGTASRVAVGSDGTVAALFGKKLRVFASAGGALGEFDVPTNRDVNDVAVDGASQTVFATGFKQDDGAPCTQLQIPFLRAYSYSGTPKWTGYDWNKDEVGAANECADSRGYALGMGRDGKLYFAGESHGGNTVFRRLPQDLAAFAPAVKNDPYNDPYNLNGAAPIGFYARIDPATGTMEKAQFLCTRLSSGKGNAARPRAIAADEDGNVVVGGASACCIEGGDVKTVNGQPAMPAYAGGGFVLVVSADFTQRLQWTAFNGPTGGGANGVSVAAAKSGIALLSQQAIDKGKNASTAEIPLLTFDALLPSPGGGESDAWLGVMPPAP